MLYKLDLVDVRLASLEPLDPASGRQDVPDPRPAEVVELRQRPQEQDVGKRAEIRGYLLAVREQKVRT